MKVYWKFFFIFFIAFGLTTIAYKFAAKGLKKYNNHTYTRLDEIFTDNTPYDIVFIGSSRTHSFIMPRIIDSITGLSSYNAGVDGGTLLDFKMTFDGYLQHHPSPKLLVLTIDPASFNHSSTLYNYIQYLPFINKNIVLEKTFSVTNFNTFLLKYLPAFSFIYMDDYSRTNAIAGLMGKREIAEGEFQDKGYLSNSNQCLDSLKFKGDLYTITPDTSNVERFQSIINTCKYRNIQLIITYAPEYKYQFSRSIKNFSTFTDLMYSMTSANKLTYYRDDSLSMNNEPCLFRDIRHVNMPGAIEYCKIIGQRLKIIQK